MIRLVTMILTDVLLAIYQSFWFSIILAICFMFFFLFAAEHGWKESVRIWIEKFKDSSYFRKVFLLVLYTTTVLFRTLFSRDTWFHPLSNVMGGWWIWWDGGEIPPASIENFLLLMPFTVLLLWTVNANDNMRQKVLKNGMKLGTVLWQSLKISFIFSFTIENLQLLLHLGTWQVSDLYYNSVGGMTGGLIYWIGWKVEQWIKAQQGKKNGGAVNTARAARATKALHAKATKPADAKEEAACEQQEEQRSVDAPQEETVDEPQSTDEPQSIDDDMTIYLPSLD